MTFFTSIDRSHTISILETTRQTLIRGVFAAMTLPRNDKGAVDLEQLARHIEFLLHSGVEGIVLNGATGEYCLTSSEEIGAMLRRARQVAGANVKLIAAVGGASTLQTSQRVTIAESHGADGLLLPMPYFFPYEQQDLITYTEEVARQSKLPILLYNLPSFTTPLEPLTVLKLLHTPSQIMGVKDSSGSLDMVRLLKKRAPQANLVIGNDAALYGALLECVCDGVVSGVACVLPELMLELYRSVSENALSERSLQLKAVLEEFIGWLVQLPVPWGLKAIAAERGLAKAEYALPLSAARSAQVQAFAVWFREKRSLLLA